MVACFVFLKHGLKQKRLRPELVRAILPEGDTFSPWALRVQEGHVFIMGTWARRISLGPKGYVFIPWAVQLGEFLSSTYSRSHFG